MIVLSTLNASFIVLATVYGIAVKINPKTSIYCNEKFIFHTEKLSTLSVLNVAENYHFNKLYRNLAFAFFCFFIINSLVMEIGLMSNLAISCFVVFLVLIVGIGGNDASVNLKTSLITLIVNGVFFLIAGIVLYTFLDKANMISIIPYQYIVYLTICIYMFRCKNEIRAILLAFFSLIMNFLLKCLINVCMRLSQKEPVDILVLIISALNIWPSIVVAIR